MDIFIFIGIWCFGASSDPKACIAQVITAELFLHLRL